MFDRTTILQLHDAGEPFREIAYDEVLANFPQFGDLFFAWFSARETSLIEKAARELCFLNTGIPPKNPQANTAERIRKGDVEEPFGGDSEESKNYKVFAGMGRTHRAFMQLLNESLATHPDPHRLLRELHISFPGIRKELEVRYSGLEHEVPDDNLLRQLMVFVCGQCNLHCPYCFSHDLVRQEISSHDLDRIFEWAAREGCSVVTPCGGEPLLYSRLEQFLTLVREYGLTTYLATNFTVDVSRVKGFTQDIVRRLYVHFTRESLANPRLLEIIDRNIELCKERRIDMSARVNITSTNEAEALRWIDLTAEKGIKRLNIALTIPSRFQANSFTDPSGFEEYIPLICRMIEYAQSKNVALGIAKPLPLCLFPEEVAAHLLRADANMALCGIHQSAYMNNLSLSTDMNFSPCLGLSDVRVPFDMSLSWSDLEARFAPGVERLLRREVFAQCRDCFLNARGLCQGFCLSYKYRPDEEFC